MTDRVGQRIGNYRLERLLGSGGFAEVYLGEHLHLGTQAAIKILDARLAGDEAERFREEARTIARLKYAHIVRVLDFDVQDDTPFLVMDYAPGGTLRQKHPNGSQTDPAIVLPSVQQIASALQFAHDQRLVHRDIKPDNMLLDARGEVLLSDFGIATVAAQSSRLENPQNVAGTVAYMAPEQLQGYPRPASDQYALGIVIYEWLSGALPFQGSFMEIASQHVLKPPPSLRERLPALAPAVEQVVLTALAKDPKERFASVVAFATAFENACQAATPSQWLDQPTRRGRQPPVFSFPPGYAAPAQFSPPSLTPPHVFTDPTRRAPQPPVRDATVASAPAAPFPPPFIG